MTESRGTPIQSVLHVMMHVLLDTDALEHCNTDRIGDTAVSNLYALMNVNITLNLPVVKLCIRAVRVYHFAFVYLSEDIGQC